MPLHLRQQFVAPGTRRSLLEPCPDEREQRLLLGRIGNVAVPAGMDRKRAAIRFPPCRFAFRQLGKEIGYGLAKEGTFDPSSFLCVLCVFVV